MSGQRSPGPSRIALRQELKAQIRPRPPPVAWQTLTAVFQLGFGSDGRLFDRWSITDEYANFPSIPEDHAHPPQRAPEQRHPGHPDHQAFVDTMLAQLDKSICPSPQNWEDGLVIRTWYIHHELHGRNAEPRMVKLTADSTQWIFRLTAAWAGIIEPDSEILCRPVRGPGRDYIASYSSSALFWIGHYVLHCGPGWTTAFHSGLFFP